MPNERISLHFCKATFDSLQYRVSISIMRRRQNFVIVWYDIPCTQRVRYSHSSRRSQKAKYLFWSLPDKNLPIYVHVVARNLTAHVISFRRMIDAARAKSCYGDRVKYPAPLAYWQQAEIVGSEIYVSWYLQQ